MMKFIIYGLITGGLLAVCIFGKSLAVTNMPDNISQDKKLTAENFDCSDGWRITGYFTPVETDYDSTETREIEIKNFGKMDFNVEFLNTVFDEDVGFGEGWGKTRFGWYLGNYDGQ